MANIPEYQVETRSISSDQSTGGFGQLQDFNPVSENAGATLAKGFDDIADEVNRRNTKEDMAWAQAQYTNQQVTWAKNIRGYTDPDQLDKDLQDNIKQVMTTAPSGRASDFFVAHMDHLAPILTRRAVMNQARAATNATAANYVSSANSLAALANGKGLPDTSVAPDPDGTPAQPPSTPAPMLSREGLQQVYGQLSQINAAAQGTVPDALITSTTNKVKQAIGVGMVKAASISDGPGAIADQMEKDPTQVVPKDVLPLIQTQLPSMISDLRTQQATNLGVAQKNAQEVAKNIVGMIDQGNYPGDDNIKNVGDMMADVLGGKGTKKAEEVKLNFMSLVNGSVDAYNFKASSMGLPADALAKNLNDFNQAHDDNPHALELAKTYSDKLLTTLARSPADYPLLSPTMRDSYNASYSQLTANPKDEGAHAHFIATLDGMVTLQNKAKGADESTSPQEVNRLNGLAGVIPASQAQQIVANISKSDNTQAAADQLHKIQDMYGKYSTNAMQDLQRQGLDPQYLALASFRDTPTEGLLINAINESKQQKGGSTLNTALGIQDGDTKDTNAMLKNITASTNKAIKPYLDAVSVFDPDAASKVADLVTNVTKYNKVHNGAMSVEDAASSAADSVINSKVDFGQMNNRSFIVTKQNVPNGDTQSVINGAKKMLPQIASGDMGNIDFAAVIGKPNLTAEEKDQVTQAINQAGFWTQTSDGKHLRLVLDQNKAMRLTGIRFPSNSNMLNSAGTGIATVRVTNGAPMEFPLTGFQAVDKWEGGGLPPFASSNYKERKAADVDFQGD